MWPGSAGRCHTALRLRLVLQIAGILAGRFRAQLVRLVLWLDLLGGNAAKEWLPEGCTRQCCSSEEVKCRTLCNSRNPRLEWSCRKVFGKVAQDDGSPLKYCRRPGIVAVAVSIYHRFAPCYKF